MSHTPNTPISSPPGHQDLDASLAAPAQVDQVGGTIAALFVRRCNHYLSLGCDCYDQDRNALTWPGGTPGIFHPPCRAWGQLSHFAKPAEGEAALAIWSIDMARKFGGIVEHPYASRLWRAVGCLSFGVRDRFDGVLIPVMQSWFGHRAPKKTCLYIVGPVPHIEPAFVETTHVIENMGRAERERTPAPFAAFLVSVARACL